MPESSFSIDEIKMVTVAFVALVILNGTLVYAFNAGLGGSEIESEVPQPVPGDNRINVDVLGDPPESPGSVEDTGTISWDGMGEKPSEDFTNGVTSYNDSNLTNQLADDWTVKHNGGLNAIIDTSRQPHHIDFNYSYFKGKVGEYSIDGINVSWKHNGTPLNDTLNTGNGQCGFGDPVKSCNVTSDWSFGYGAHNETANAYQYTEAIIIDGPNGEIRYNFSIMQEKIGDFLRTPTYVAEDEWDGKDLVVTQFENDDWIAYGFRNASSDSLHVGQNFYLISVETSSGWLTQSNEVGSVRAVELGNYSDYNELSNRVDGDEIVFTNLEYQKDGSAGVIDWELNPRSDGFFSGIAYLGSVFGYFIVTIIQGLLNAFINVVYAFDFLINLIIFLFIGWAKIFAITASVNPFITLLILTPNIILMFILFNAVMKIAKAIPTT